MSQTQNQTDVLIIGSGVSGCATAYALAKQNLQVTLISSDSDPRQCHSYQAKGGVIYPAQGDTSESLAQDLQKTGEGLSYTRAIEHFVTQGPRIVEDVLLNELEIEFDRKPDGELIYYQDPSHSTARVIKRGETTGAAILEALLVKLESFPNVKMLTNHTAIDLITLEKHSTKPTDIYRKPTCIGAYVLKNDDGTVTAFLAKETVLATGGFGQIFLHTTNPKGSRGDGIAMANRAGARLLNMQHIQFHPTTLHMPDEPATPLDDGLRIEGAEILSQNRQPFMQRYHEKGSQAPTETVAKGAYMEMLNSQSDHLWLDCSRKDPDWLRDKFTGLYEHLHKYNLDITRDPIPVVPAAHYSCGGIAVDKAAQTTVQRLRALGETACTGLHGKQRLESTSLLESLVWAQSCADDIASQLKRFVYYFPTIKEWKSGTDPVDPACIQQDWMAVKQTMWDYGVFATSPERTQRAQDFLQRICCQVNTAMTRSTADPSLVQLRNGAETAKVVLAASS